MSNWCHRANCSRWDWAYDWVRWPQRTPWQYHCLSFWHFQTTDTALRLVVCAAQRNCDKTMVQVTRLSLQQALPVGRCHSGEEFSLHSANQTTHRLFAWSAKDEREWLTCLKNSNQTSRVLSKWRIRFSKESKQGFERWANRYADARCNWHA